MILKKKEEKTNKQNYIPNTIDEQTNIQKKFITNNSPTSRKIIIRRANVLSP